MAEALETLRRVRGFGVQPPPPLPPGSVVPEPAYGAAALEALRAIMGPRFLDYTTPQTIEELEESWLSAGTGGLPMGAWRIGVRPGLEGLASAIVKRGLKQPYFHGTPDVETLMAQGFDPERLGRAAGLRLGEPAGISASRDLSVAESFAGRNPGAGIVRVGVDVPPSSVGQFVDPAFAQAYRSALQGAMSTPIKIPSSWSHTGQYIPQTMESPLQVLYRQMSEEVRGDTPLDWEKAATFFGDRARQAINTELSRLLQQQGVEAIAYNPRRYGEFELRVLDPTKAVPLGTVPLPPRNISSASRSSMRDSLDDVTRQLQFDQARLDALRARGYPGSATPEARAQWTEVERLDARIQELQRYWDQLSSQLEPSAQYFRRASEVLRRAEQQAPRSPVHLRDLRQNLPPY